MKILQIIIITSLAFYTQVSLATLNIFTCEPEWAALAKEIGGNQVKTFSATHGTRPPLYSGTPQFNCQNK